jgi:flagellar hook protein FlgE
MTINTIYTASTGMLTFSKGLNTVSNNVANLNTPGFKRSDLLFRDLFSQYKQTGENGGQLSSQQTGAGVTDAGTVTSFAAGDIQQTGNSTDFAIRGNGFFVLRDTDQHLYTRSGQFEFNDDGFLSSTNLGTKVAGIDVSNNLVDININNFRNSPATPTSRINLVGNLSSGGTTHEITPVEVIDSLGATEDLTLTFTNNNATTPRSWLIDVTDSNSNVIGDDLEIRFQADGSLEAGFNEVSFTFNSNTVVLNFGDSGGFNGTTQFSSGTTSTAAVDSQDGLTLGSFLDIAVDSAGVLEASYSNGETAEVGQLALAWFSDLQSMRQIGNGIFLVSNNQQPIIDRASSGVMGDIVGQSIEISNVELTQEFTDLIIIQRGFQASSQIMSAANEMIQELLSAGRGQ